MGRRRQCRLRARIHGAGAHQHLRCRWSGRRPILIRYSRPASSAKRPPASAPLESFPPREVFQGLFFMFPPPAGLPPRRTISYSPVPGLLDAGNPMGEERRNASEIARCTARPCRVRQRTLRQVLEYSPQSTIRPPARRRSDSRDGTAPDGHEHPWPWDVPSAPSGRPAAAPSFVLPRPAEMLSRRASFPSVKTTFNIMRHQALRVSNTPYSYSRDSVKICLYAAFRPYLTTVR